MYYIAKFLQAAGLTLVLIGFLARFPQLIDMKILGLAALLFIAGWVLQNYVIKR